MLATACTASKDTSPTTASEGTLATSDTAVPDDTTATTEGSTIDVPWDDYAAQVKITIDDLAIAKDCTGLQAQFDTADANNEATMTRTGHNNADLMSYIDDKLRTAGCY